MGILFLPASQGRCSSLLFCSAVRPLLLLRLRPRLTPTTAMAMALVATPPLDPLDSATPVATTASVRPRPSPRLMPRLMPTTTTATLDLDTPALDTLDLDTLDLATAVATPDLAMEATPVATMASVRPRPSPRLMPTTETATPDLATLA